MELTFEQSFLIEYFKEMRKEINLRIKNHSYLVTYKIISVGVIISFLFTRDSSTNFFKDHDVNEMITIIGLMIIPIISMLFDIMIANNINCIYKIGTFIRDKIEPSIPTIELWEKYSGQKDTKSRNFGVMDIMYLSFFSLLSLLFPLIVLWNIVDINNWIKITVTVILIIGFLLVVYILNKKIGDFKPIEIKTLHNKC